MKTNVLIIGIIIMVVGLAITGGAYASIQGTNAKISECNTTEGQLKALFDSDYEAECENAEDMGVMYATICMGGIPIIIIGIIVIIVGLVSKTKVTTQSQPQQYQQPYQPQPQYPPQPQQYPPPQQQPQQPPPQHQYQQPPPQYPPQQPPQYPPQY